MAREEHNGMTLAEYTERILWAAAVMQARAVMYEQTGVRVTTLVWFGNRYRAMPQLRDG